MHINNEWKDYRIIATGDGEKLERWKDIVLLRPDPQVIWHAAKPLCNVVKPDARYIRSDSGGGHWEFDRKLPDSWVVGWRDLRFKVRPMNFKHTGLFPEQAANWATMIELIRGANRPIRVLNLFAYTGGATVACLSAGASVCHVDAAKNMVELAKENVALSHLDNNQVRYIVDDCRKFVKREIRRGNCYDAIVLDPPAFGRGASGEEWKLERDIHDFLALCAQVLSEKPLFVLLNSYTTGLQPTVLSNLLKLTMPQDGKVTSYEVCLPTDEATALPCGASGLWIEGEKYE